RRPPFIDPVDLGALRYIPLLHRHLSEKAICTSRGGEGTLWPSKWASRAPVRSRNPLQDKRYHPRGFYRISGLGYKRCLENTIPRSKVFLEPAMLLRRAPHLGYGMLAIGLATVVGALTVWLA